MDTSMSGRNDCCAKNEPPVSIRTFTTAGNPDANADLQLLRKLGLRSRQTQEEGAAPAANAAQGCGCGCTCG